MNERIKQLLSEAKIYDGYDSMTQAITTCPRDLEKFAELIVKECIENVEQFDHHINPAREVVPTIISQIKEHFGVEE
jgi:hypothetical protein